MFYMHLRKSRKSIATMLGGLLFLVSSSVVFAEKNATLLKNGQWRDSNTGLIWSRCSLGQVWDGSSCVGDAVEYTWDDAKSQAENANYAERKDWRLPTIKELGTLIIKDKAGFSPSNNILFTPKSGVYGWFWSSSPRDEPDYNEGFAGTARFIDFDKGVKDAVLRLQPCYVRLVRYSK